MQLFSRNKAIVALALSALALGACGDDVTVPVAPAAPTTLSITPPSATMNIGEAVNFAVQISNSASTLASCTSSSATVATATVSGSSCRVTAIGAGNATITAAASTGQSAAASVSVVAPAPAITALAVSPSAAQLAVGSSLTVVPTVNRANSTVAVVYTYASSTASVATVSATGMVTAVAPGTTTITVTAAGTGTGFAAASLTSAATITVSDRAPGLTSLQVSPATAALTVGGTQAVTANVQGPRASAATTTKTYGTSAPAIATVSATGVITAVAAGTATITVTAQSTQDGAFAASSLTGLVTVTVSNPAVVSINISALTQGPTTTSYSTGNNGSGIVSAINTQVGQSIDINNTRDQIQMTATLETNGARVDSVVAYVANADGTSRTSVGRQSFPSAAASGSLSLYINTAEFTADFTAGTAAVKFANGQKRISVSAFSGATELQSTNSQTVNFNNVDGYAASATAPAKSATNSAGQVWFGGADSLTTRLGSATIVPVFYTAGRTLNNITLSMRQGAYGETQACSEYLVFQTGPYKFVYGGAQAVAGDTTVVNCSTLESAADHVVGVSAATDNNGVAAPTTSFAGGFRTSTTVTAPVARKLDYVAPTVAAIRAKTSWPGDSTSTWVNGSYSFNDSTVASTDAGVGFAGTTSKGGRSWQWYGCGVLSTAPVTFSGTTSDLAECSTSNSATEYKIKFVDSDMLGNSATSAVVSVGVDKTKPVITWAEADSVLSATAVTFTPSVSDAKSSFADSGSVGGFIAKFANLGVAYSAPAGRSCTNSAGSYTNTKETTYWTIASSSCTISSTHIAKFYETADRLGVANSSGERRFVAATSGTNQAFVYSVTANDKAGNQAISTHRALVDGTNLPTVVVGQASAFAIAANPTFNVTYTDLRAKATWVGLTYGSTMLRYTANTINASAFGTYSLTATKSYSSTGTGTDITAPVFVASVPTPTPFIVGTTASDGKTTPAVLTTVTSNVLDFMGNTAASNATDAISSASLPSASALTTSDGSLTVLQTLSSGLQAQFNGVSGTTVNPFSRIDFYRKSATNQYDYLGSSSAAPASTVTAGAVAQYTFNIGSYASVTPTGAVNTVAATGDEIIAVGVRSNGMGTVSLPTVIGGAYLTVNLTGLPAGVTVPVTITGPNSFTTTVSVGNTSATKVAVSFDGTYTATYGQYSPSTGGVYTPGSASNSMTVSGNGAYALGTIAYTFAGNTASVTVSGLPTNRTTSLVFSLAGQNSVTYTGVAGGSTTAFSLPAAGTWTITPSATVSGSVATAGLTYAASATTVTLAGGAAVAATVTYANTVYYIPFTTTVPASSGVVPSISYTPSGASAASTWSTIGTANMTFTTTAPLGTAAFVVNPVAVAGVTYGASNPAATTPTLNGASALTVDYNSAKIKVVFAGATAAALTDLAGYTVPVSVTGPSGNTSLGSIAIDATGTTITLPVTGTYGIDAIASIVLGGSTYTFAPGAAAAMPYQLLGTTVTVTITKTP